MIGEIGRRIWRRDWATRLVALLVFTIIIRYERPGHTFGALTLCVDVATMREAEAAGRCLAAKELKPGIRLDTITVRDDRCWWMPGDAPGEYIYTQL